MKWAAIANITGQVNATAQDFLKEKIEKDAAAIATTEWADFLQGTHVHVSQATQLTDVAPDPHTGKLTCLVKMEANHPDFAFNNQPLSQYILKSLEKRGSQLLGRVKNPLAKKFLESKLQGHTLQVANNLAEQEAHLIHDKRKVMIGDAVEKLAKSTYQNPADVEAHLADMMGVVNTIADSPSEREKLSRLAHEKIVEAAAMGTIHKNPGAFLNNTEWQGHLSLESYVRFRHMAKTLAHQSQVQLQHQVSSVSKSHFESLLHTGKGLPGFEGQVRRAYGENSPAYQGFQAKHALYQAASTAMQSIAKGSLSEGAAVIQSLTPESGDPEYAQKLKMVQVLQQQLKHQFTEAKGDPAAFVEKTFVEEIPEHLPFLKRLQLRKSLQTQKGIPEYAQKYLMKEEKEKFLASLESGTGSPGTDSSGNPYQVEAAVKSLLSLEDHEQAIGKEVMEELLANKEDLSLLVGLYAEQALKGGDLAPVLLKMIPIQKQLFSSISASEAKELEKKVNAHPDITAFQNALTHGQPHHVPMVNQRVQGVLHLARFYQIDRGEKMDAAVNHAVKDLITHEFITPIRASSYLWEPSIAQEDGLKIPKTILMNGTKVILDEAEVNHHLLDIRKNLVEGTIPFDFTGTFGAVPENPALQEEAKTQSQNLLREGRFRLAPNHKEVYYAVRMADGSEQPLLKSPQEILFFPLQTSPLNPRSPALPPSREASFAGGKLRRGQALTTGETYP
jgi:hypothetical protein